MDKGRIVDIQDGFRPSGSGSTAECIDLHGKTVMPSLVNSHIHFTMWRSFGSIKEHRDTATQSFRAVRAGINCLRKGITSARDMGHKDEVHLLTLLIPPEPQFHIRLESSLKCDKDERLDNRPSQVDEPTRRADTSALTLPWRTSEFADLSFSMPPTSFQYSTILYP